MSFDATMFAPPWKSGTVGGPGSCLRRASATQWVAHPFAYYAKRWDPETWINPKDKRPMFPPLQRTQGWGTHNRDRPSKQGRATRHHGWMLTFLSCRLKLNHLRHLSTSTSSGS